MEINYWRCKYHDYDEDWDGEEEIRIYRCSNPAGNGYCDLNNKYCGETDCCKILGEEC